VLLPHQHTSAVLKPSPISYVLHNISRCKPHIKVLKSVGCSPSYPLEVEPYHLPACERSFGLTSHGATKTGPHAPICCSRYLFLMQTNKITILPSRVLPTNACIQNSKRRPPSKVMCPGVSSVLPRRRFGNFNSVVISNRSIEGRHTASSRPAQLRSAHECLRKCLHDHGLRLRKQLRAGLST
jgi:hypothetical protein